MVIPPIQYTSLYPLVRVRKSPCFGCLTIFTLALFRPYRLSPLFPPHTQYVTGFLHLENLAHNFFLPHRWSPYSPPCFQSQPNWVPFFTFWSRLPRTYFAPRPPRAFSFSWQIFFPPPTYLCSSLYGFFPRPSPCYCFVTKVVLPPLVEFDFRTISFHLPIPLPPSPPPIPLRLWLIR